MDLLPTLQNFSVFILFCMGVALVVSGILFMIAEKSMGKAGDSAVPIEAGFTETLQSIPIVIVLAIDLLDFALDFFAFPIVWVILDRYNLGALRNVSAVEALIPGTQVIPTLTLCWIAVNWLGIRF